MRTATKHLLLSSVSVLVNVALLAICFLQGHVSNAVKGLLLIGTVWTVGYAWAYADQWSRRR